MIDVEPVSTSDWPSVAKLVRLYLDYCTKVENVPIVDKKNTACSVRRDPVNRLLPVVSGVKMMYSGEETSDSPWFHGSISREETNRLLTHKPDGTFLIRESTNYPGDFTLCIAFNGKVEHYRIFHQNNMLTCDHEGFFESLQLLVAHYMRGADGLCHKLVEALLVDDGDRRRLTKLNESNWIVRKEHLQLLDVIGHGEFGDVMGGLFKGKKVAVKVMKRGNHVIESLLQEASMMMTLKHQNLVELLGVVLNDGTDVYLVTEFMPNGSLLDYVRSRGRQMVTQSQQLNFAFDICCGMVYLEKKNLVHRDLAARNILLSEDMVAKVADFGLAKSVDSIDAEDANCKFPIKWTAPEALCHNKFTGKSDVWSFGILLWEIYSFGRVPYPRIPVQEVVRYIKNGYRMEPPEGCPSDIAELMSQTWTIKAECRPNFQQILKALQLMLQNNNSLSSIQRGMNSLNSSRAESFKSYVEEEDSSNGNPSLNLISGEQEVTTPCENVILYFPFSDSRQGLIGNVHCTFLRLIFLPATEMNNQRSYFRTQRIFGNSNFETALLNVYRLEHSCNADPKKFRHLVNFLSFSDDIHTLKVYCKDFRVFSFDLHFSNQCKNFVNCLLQYSFPMSLENLPCFHLRHPTNWKRKLKKCSFDCREDWQCELQRCGIGGGHSWRITQINENNRLIRSYSCCFVVPSSWYDNMIETSVSNWKERRVPFWCWSHLNGSSLVRSSSMTMDTEVTRKQWLLFEAAVGESHAKKKQPVVIDVSLSVRDVANAYDALRKICSIDNSTEFWAIDSRWYSEVESTGWLCLVQKCLSQVHCCVETITILGNSVILREKLNQDGCCVIASLVQICCDPFYRTIDGFEMLIRKEWLAFSHPFASRLHGLTSAGRSDEELAPFFLLFLDCVFQLLVQYPTDFQFTEHYLIAMWDLSLTGLVVSFSTNCLRDRIDYHHSDDHTDYWTEFYHDDYRQFFKNSCYLFAKSRLAENYSSSLSAGCSSADILSPSPSLSSSASLSSSTLLPESQPFVLNFWQTAFLRWSAPAQVANGGDVQLTLHINSVNTHLLKLLQEKIRLEIGANTKTCPDSTSATFLSTASNNDKAGSDSSSSCADLSNLRITSAFPFTYETLPIPDYLYILPIRQQPKASRPTSKQQQQIN
ncbi:Tyrosine-protein kinase CSK [Trichinella pseudospiralis]|uniref:Tyrosine-protein kinase n=1 Tax=Trichinella pseudospiralis TaxID=6337 RepID=A0A0V0YBP9_TRIPS|nr:Tyrosine-protein kinase CSK [Trichinella pseudospiralis]